METSESAGRLEGAMPLPFGWDALGRKLGGDGGKVAPAARRSQIHAKTTYSGSMGTKFRPCGAESFQKGTRPGRV